jgi:hypothetical protein
VPGSAAASGGILVAKVPVANKASAIANRFFILPTFGPADFSCLYLRLIRRVAELAARPWSGEGGVHAALTLSERALIQSRSCLVSDFREKDFACGKP